MASYDDIKQKAKETIDSIADASVDAYKVAEEKARVLAKKTRLRAGIVNEKATIRRLSVELGTAYYEKYKDVPLNMFNQLCQEITCAHERIAAKEKEIAELKANTGVKFEDKDIQESETIPIPIYEPKPKPKAKAKVKKKTEPKPEPEPKDEVKPEEKSEPEAEKKPVNNPWPDPDPMMFPDPDDDDKKSDG